MYIGRAFAVTLQKAIAAELTAARWLRLARLLAAFPAFVPIYEQMHRLRELLNIKHRTRRACKPLTRELVAFIDQLAASCLEPRW